MSGGKHPEWTPSKGKAGLVELRHVGGLDGLRGLAVIAVVLFHGGVGWAQGGFLGVEIFFVLSGFLITSLLVAEWRRSDRIALPGFWARRARRLLPAMFVLVAVVGVYYALAGQAAAVPGLLGDGLATLFYFSNWHQIAIGTSYFAASGPVSPFQHTWSLAIEEQFYVVWPLVLVGLFWVAARRRSRSPRGSLTLLLTVAVAGAVSSAIAITVLYHGGAGLNRVYYGTDTRASGLLTGAALALWLARRQIGGEQWPAATRRARVAGGVGSLGVLVALLAALRLASGDSGWLYPFGMVGVDLAVIALIAAVVLLPGSPVARLLSLAPLRAVGLVSYGVYLWHFPLFLWLTTASTGLSGAPLLALRVGITLAVSFASYVVVEQPIRQRRRPTWMLHFLAPVGAGAAVASLLVASAASAMPPAAGGPQAPSAPVGLAGTGPGCQIRLIDDARYGVAPVPLSSVAQFELNSLDHQRIVWKHVGTSRFSTCPPKRIMVIGDSLAFTLALPAGADENRYGAEIADAAHLGCAFGTRGQLDVNGQWEAPAPGCTNALSSWAAAASRFHAQEIVIEMGYRDEFDWRWAGQIEHLGDPAFDAYLQQQIDDYVRVLGANGTKLLFLSVPYASPPAQSNGAPAPAASPARHSMINMMLHKAAAADPGNATVLDIDSMISPGGHYQATINGQLCRFDGVHFTIYCAKLLEPKILTQARTLLG